MKPVFGQRPKILVEVDVRKHFDDQVKPATLSKFGDCCVEIIFFRMINHVMSTLPEDMLASFFCSGRSS